MSHDHQIEPLEKKKKNLLLETQQCSEGPKYLLYDPASYAYYSINPFNCMVDSNNDCFASTSINAGSVWWL